jgi:hypothetical protein
MFMKIRKYMKGLIKILNEKIIIFIRTDQPNKESNINLLS